MAEAQVYYDSDIGKWRLRDHGGWGPTGDHVTSEIAMEYVDSLLERIAELKLSAQLPGWALLSAVVPEYEHELPEWLRALDDGDSYRNRPTAENSVWALKHCAERIEADAIWKARWDALQEAMHHYDPPSSSNPLATITIDASTLGPPRGDNMEALADALIEAKA